MVAGRLCAALIGLSAMAAGCSTDVAVRSPEAGLAGLGDSDAVVFPAEAVLLSGVDGDREASGDARRRDGELVARAPDSALGQSMWPDADRPSLSLSRRVYIGSQPESYIYFAGPRRDFRGHGSFHRR